MASSSCLTSRKIHTTAEPASIMKTPTRNAWVAPGREAADVGQRADQLGRRASRRSLAISADADARVELRDAAADGRGDRAMWALVKWLPTVARAARPSAPPTCCIVFSTPEPTPASSGRRWWTAVRVSGTKTAPMPSAIRHTYGRICGPVADARAQRLTLADGVQHVLAAVGDGQPGEPVERDGRHQRADAGDVARVDPVDQVGHDRRG